MRNMVQRPVNTENISSQRQLIEVMSTYRWIESPRMSATIQAVHLPDDTTSTPLRDINRKEEGERSRANVSAVLENTKPDASIELEEDMRCMICLKEKGKRAKVVPCGHEFDYICISTWISNDGPAAETCPYCRGGITHMQLATSNSHLLDDPNEDNEEQHILKPVSSGTPDAFVNYRKTHLPDILLWTEKGFVQIEREAALRVTQHRLGSTKTIMKRITTVEIRAEAVDDWEGLEFQADGAEGLAKFKQLMKMFTILEKDYVAFGTQKGELYGVALRNFGSYPRIDSRSYAIDFEETYEVTVDHNPTESLNRYTLITIRSCHTIHEIVLEKNDTDIGAPISIYDDTLSDARAIIGRFTASLDRFTSHQPDQPGRQQLDPTLTYILEPWKGEEKCADCNDLHQHGGCLITWYYNALHR